MRFYSMRYCAILITPEHNELIGATPDCTGEVIQANGYGDAKCSKCKGYRLSESFSILEKSE